MTDLIVSPSVNSLAPLSIFESWISSRNSPETRRNYVSSMRELAAWLGTQGVAVDPEGAAALLLSEESRAHELADRWKSHLTASGAKARTISARLGALRNLVLHAKRLRRVGWTLDVVGPRPPKTTVTGIDVESFLRVLAAAKTTRDRALVLMLGARGCRISSVAGIRREDVRPGGVRLSLKGRHDAEWLVNIGPPDEALNALAAASKGGRLFPSARTLRAVVKRLGDAAGVPALHPHRLRHAFAEWARVGCGGDLRLVADLTGHEDVRTLQLHYLHADLDAQRAALSKMYERLPRSQKTPSPRPGLVPTP